jgi:hypothetical protein
MLRTMDIGQTSSSSIGTRAKIKPRALSEKPGESAGLFLRVVLCVTLN